MILLVSLAVIPLTAQAGYEQPCHIDGCQSPDGRFLITAGPVGRLTNHRPNQWRFIWRDTKENKESALPARGVQCG